MQTKTALRNVGPDKSANGTWHHFDKSDGGVSIARAGADLGRNEAVLVEFSRPANMVYYKIGVTAGLDICLCSSPSGTACRDTKLEPLQMPGRVGASMTKSVAGQPNEFSLAAPRVTNTMPEGFPVAMEGLGPCELQVQFNAIGRVTSCAPTDGIFSAVFACPSP
ncbi:hypothetical protein [Roseateles oligotrophus]|uniref:Uncharacterized protein n=1 Tax=Roseateles oligotrophus TaxID=1769250 RepID=A0ABT2YFJ4_9BURK|nr:hypothetical protein [Roseateles oligotrophus]MCV2368820.1 hypothetical protein [Roseateles oligotrophus]